MKYNIDVNVEGSELVLKNKAGDYVIIPKKYRLEVQDMIKDGCHSCIDKLVETLPVMEDYAQDGSLLPDWDKIKATLNPKNWGVPDYTEYGTRGQAYAAAKKAGEKEFMWNNKRFNTKSDMSPEQQMKVYGITDERIQGTSGVMGEIRDRIAKNILPEGSGHIKSAIKAILTNTPEVAISDDVIPTMQLFPTKKDTDEYMGVRRDDDYGAQSQSKGAHVDALNLVMGKPQQYNSFTTSKYHPTIIKLGNKTQYYTLSDESFKDRIIENIDVNSKVKQVYKQKPKSRLDSEHVLGDFTIDFGMDDRGEYVSIYDVQDYSPKNRNESPLKIGKPFEIYDRIYIKNYGDGQKKRMYYSDKELSELDVNKKNFDTLALQRELSNRGYKLPKSTKSDGTFDGIWGDETKAALLDYQNKMESKKTIEVEKNINNVRNKDNDFNAVSEPNINKNIKAKLEKIINKK